MTTDPLADALAELRCVTRERDDALAFLDNAVSDAPEPLKALGEWLADLLAEDDWPTAERFLNAAVKSCADLMPRSEHLAALAAANEAAVDIAKRHHSTVDLNGELWHEGQDWASDRIAKAIRVLTTADQQAALDRMIQAARAVKPLVWRIYSPNGNCDASTAFGPYSIENCYEDGWGMWTPQEYGGGDDPANGFHDTIEAAKAAAQADYEARIHAALTDGEPT